MPEGAPATNAVFLQPGELVTTDKAVVVKTVVGSCVAITVRVPQRGLAAIAHCLLPAAGASLDGIGCSEAPRYVDTAVELIFRELSARGVVLSDFEIKIFGGADTMRSGYRVGDRNVAAARDALAARGLRLAASVVGGCSGRVLEFHTQSGEVLVKTLPGSVSSREAVRL
jgi:chemotaxis protein CheD